MAEGGAAASKGKSVLIIAWFYAEPKQIELVKRIYKKKGFEDIVVQESPVKQISTPRGWYNTFVRSGLGIVSPQPSPSFSPSSPLHRSTDSRSAILSSLLYRAASTYISFAC